MLYGEPATVAVAAAPALVSVTLVTLSLLSRPLVMVRMPHGEGIHFPVGLALIVGGDRQRRLGDCRPVAGGVGHRTTDVGDRYGERRASGACRTIGVAAEDVESRSRAARLRDARGVGRGSVPQWMVSVRQREVGEGGGWVRVDKGSYLSGKCGAVDCGCHWGRRGGHGRVCDCGRWSGKDLGRLEASTTQRVDLTDRVVIGCAIGQAGIGERGGSHAGLIGSGSLAAARRRAIDVVAGGPGRSRPVKNDLSVPGRRGQTGRRRDRGRVEEDGGGPTRQRDAADVLVG